MEKRIKLEEKAYLNAQSFEDKYEAEWIINLRNTLFGGLILGKGFLYADLVRYIVGAIAAYALDRF
ncbi:DUF2809 domain-containing protein [Paenibacillus frigoriresistens]|uniref:DUF2809 domain-containing protein n=1 Tax=Paenibacillus alginolyticus TaxID=59839 RepID=UPI001565B15C|nr:DUF2809 domain-containing protein [Paenibacillus frigoriresistens]NRF94838.1 DUF2809 domain-containing protein [Paenibacillus frigoriresistens]